MDLLTNWDLCKGIHEKDLTDLRGKIAPRRQTHPAGSIIAWEGEPCFSIGVILSGKVYIQKVSNYGHVIIVSTLNKGDSFGEVIIFSDQSIYPSTIAAETEATVCYILKEEILLLCQNSPVILHNFMRLLSNRVLMLNQRIQNLSYFSVRKKVAHFLLELYKGQNNLRLTSTTSRAEMAGRLCIPRPSLSRELANMKRDGIINYDKWSITIQNLNSLEGCLDK